VEEVLASVLRGDPTATVLELGVARSLEITGFDEGFAALREGAEGEVVVQASLGSRQSLTGFRLAPGVDVVHLAVQSGETSCVDDYATFPAAPPWMRQRGVQAALAAPLRSRGGVVGALQIATRKRNRAIGEGDRETVTALAAAMSMGC
jgi:GAF domain-containing protein